MSRAYAPAHRSGRTKIPENWVDRSARREYADAAQLLSLCASQIDGTVQDTLIEVEALTHSVVELARHSVSLADAVQKRLPGDMEAPSDEALEAHAEAIRREVKEGMIRFQAADRFSQRLGNVTNNLTALAEMLQEFPQKKWAGRWTEFLQQTRARCTTEEERQVFDAAFEGALPKESFSVVDGLDSEPEVFQQPAPISDRSDDV